ncbi:helix-turn-helix transcriptional regulator [Microbacterium sp.]|uniref:helix-turn-helix transcriptional regulator n=1 Tax=Microbacterium sp. TaxID=51671 RepID=UPI003A896C7C
MTARPAVATERAALILQLVPYLIGKGEVSVAEAAAEFDVSATEMTRMVEKLTVIGLPGDGGFWQMANDLFDIDWDLLDTQGIISITNTVGLEQSPRLTAREAAALLAGLQLAVALPGVGDSGVVQGLLAKLAAAAAAAPPEVVVVPDAVDDVRVTVADALRRSVAVSFSYSAPDHPSTTRTVDPVKVHIADGQWYLQGWCHLRRAMRTFHLDRVSGVSLTDIPISHATDPVPDLFAASADDAVVHVRFPAAVAPLLTEYLDEPVTSQPGPTRIGRFRMADERSVKRLAARLGGDLEVLGPAAARRAVRAWADAGLAQYR